MNADTTPVSPESRTNSNLMRWATYASLTVAITLIGTKLYAWTLTESVAMLSTLVDSLLDGAASLVTLFAVRHSLTPADREHRFGHGKAEALAALAQAAFVAGSAIVVLFHAIERLLHPAAIKNMETGVAIMIFSIVLTLFLVIFQTYVVKKSGSVAITADSLHYKGDLLINCAVIGALVGHAYFSWDLLDPLIGAAITGYLLFGAWRILGDALDMLMDRELPSEERRQVEDIVMAHESVLDLHELRTRRSGQDVFIQLHLELDPNITLMEAHVISDDVERLVRDAFKGAEVLIHQDPAGIFEAHAQHD
ncbi:MAG: cation diffusion facilitator family transporter [Alphaproteobacteria bacterium]|nr:cation diffusion facilitator family transporter [Alphaproteobacteria bacterium]